MKSRKRSTGIYYSASNYLTQHLALCVHLYRPPASQVITFSFLLFFFVFVLFLYSVSGSVDFFISFCFLFAFSFYCYFFIFPLVCYKVFSCVDFSFLFYDYCLVIFRTFFFFFFSYTPKFVYLFIHFMYLLDFHAFIFLSSISSGYFFFLRTSHFLHSFIVLIAVYVLFFHCVIFFVP